MWQTANQKRCFSLLQANKLEQALEAHQYMIVNGDESTKANCLSWSTGKFAVTSIRLQSSSPFRTAFKRQCGDRYAHSGDTAFTARNYDDAICLYSAAIDLGAVSDPILAKRSEALLEKMRWEDALLDAQTVRRHLLYCDQTLIFVIHRLSNSTLRRILDTS